MTSTAAVRQTTPVLIIAVHIAATLLLTGLLLLPVALDLMPLRVYALLVPLGQWIPALVAVAVNRWRNQGDLLDPLGRSVRISFRKLFFPARPPGRGQRGG